MSNFFEVLCVSSGPEKELDKVACYEDVEVKQLEMTRLITPVKDVMALLSRGALYILQQQADSTIHLRGNIALNMLKKTHYLELAPQKIRLFGDVEVRLPSWMLNYAWNAQLGYYSSSFLLEDLVLVEKKFR